MNVTKKHEFRKVLPLHHAWLADNEKGRRLTCNGADLSGLDLSGQNLSHIDFSNADLRDGDFTNANLSGAKFSNAKIAGASFGGAILTAANFGDLPIPKIGNIHKALLEVLTIEGNELDMKVWHTANNVHSRAGWIIVLTGEAGAELEREIGTDAAAALIYYTSDPMIERVPDWGASNAEAMADIRRLVKE